MKTAREILDLVILRYPLSFSCVRAANFNDTMLNDVIPAYRKLLESDPVPMVSEAYIDSTPDDETPLGTVPLVRGVSDEPFPLPGATN